MPAQTRESSRVLVVVAHPDDESFGCGSVIAEAVARGHTVEVCCASLGELGEVAPGYDLAGRSLGEVRHGELLGAAAVLGADVLEPLGLRDSGWDGPAAPESICGLDAGDLAERVAAVLAERGPDVVVTLAGDDGHRDHRRLDEAVTAAVLARPGVRLYRWCLPNDLMRRWAEEMTELRPDTAHLALELAELGTPAERVTTVLDCSAHLGLRRKAIAAHASQTSPYEGLSPDLADAFLSADHLIRVV